MTTSNAHPGRLRMKKSPTSNDSTRKRKREREGPTFVYSPTTPTLFSSRKDHNVSIPATFSDLQEGDEIEDDMLEEMFYEEEERRKFVEGLLDVKLKPTREGGRQKISERMRQRFRERQLEEARRRAVEKEEGERKEERRREKERERQESKRKAEKRKEEDEDLRRERERYHASWIRLLSLPETEKVTKNDVPWPIPFALPPILTSISVSTLTRFLLDGLEEDSRRSALKNAKLMYHPDRFERIVVKRMEEEEVAREEVREMALQCIKVLNEIKE